MGSSKRGRIIVKGKSRALMLVGTLLDSGYSVEIKRDFSKYDFAKKGERVFMIEFPFKKESNKS